MSSSEVNTVVVVYAGNSLPEEYSKLLLENHTTGLGLAVPDGEAITTWHLLSNEYDLTDSLKQFEEGYKGNIRYYCFQNGDNVSPQPFELMTTGEGETQQTLIAVLADGNYGEQGEADYINGGFTDHLAELVELANDDFPRLIELLGKKEFKAKLEKDLGSRAATFVIVPDPSKAICASNTQSGAGYDWGLTTKHFGFGQKKEEPVATAPKKLQLNKKPIASVVPIVPPAPKEPDKKEEQPPADPIDIAILKDKSKRFSRKNGVLWVTAPADGPGKNPVDIAKTFWNTHCAVPRPNKEQDGQEWYKKVLEGFPFTQLKASSPLHDAWGQLMGNAPKKADAVVLPPEKKEEKKEEPVAGFTLHIDKKMKEDYLGYKNSGGLPIIEEAALKEFANKYPRASLQLGETFDDILHMKPEAYARIVHGSTKHLAICLLNEMRFHILGLYSKDVTPKHVEQPAAATAPATKPKLSLPGRKVA